MNEIYYIPANYTDAGRILGLFPLRNLIETVLLVLPMLYLCIAYLPLTFSQKIIVTLCLTVPLGGFGLMGIRDESLGQWLSLWYRWRKNRRQIFYRGDVQ